ncbi:hypothetical protein BH10PSE11_BH10PSE11_06220 [soil metagenome]
MLRIFLAAFLALNFSAAHAAEDLVTWGAKAPNVTLSGDLSTVTGTTGGFGSVRSNFARYDLVRCAELELTAAGGSSRYGVGDASLSMAADYLGHAGGTGIGIWSLTEDIVGGGFAKLGTNSAPAQSIGTRYMLQLDFPNKKGWFQRNGVYRTAGANPSTGTGADFTWSTTNPLYIAASSYITGDGMKLNASAASMGVRLPAGCTAWAEQDGSSPPPPPPPPTGPTVSMLGDSIVYGSTAFGTPADWTSILGITAFNDAINSLSTAGALAGSPSPLANAQAHNPKIMIVRLAVNDYALPVATSVANMQTIIQSNRAKGITTFIQPILPVAGFYGGPTSNADIIARNAAIRTMVLAEPTALLVPAAPIAAGDYLADGIHPNAAWYATKEAPNLASYINLIR